MFYRTPANEMLPPKMIPSSNKLGKECVLNPPCVKTHMLIGIWKILITLAYYWFRKCWRKGACITVQSRVFPNAIATDPLQISHRELLVETAEPHGEDSIFLGKEKEKMGREGCVLSVKLIKERIKIGRHHASPHSPPPPPASSPSHHSKHRIMEKFCFSFKSGEHTGRVQPSRRAPTGHGVRRREKSSAGTHNGRGEAISAGPWGWGGHLFLTGPGEPRLVAAAHR